MTIEAKTVESKMTKLLDNLGLQSINEWSDMAMDEPDLYSHYAVTVGICISPDCDEITDVEPDSEDGYCPACTARAVQSIWSLLPAALQHGVCIE